MNSKQYFNLLDYKLSAKGIRLQDYKFYATSLTNEFSHGYLRFSRELTAEERIWVTENFSDFFSNSSDVERHSRSNVMALWDSKKFSNALITIKDHGFTVDFKKF